MCLGLYYDRVALDICGEILEGAFIVRSIVDITTSFQSLKNALVTLFLREPENMCVVMDYLYICNRKLYQFLFESSGLKEPYTPAKNRYGIDSTLAYLDVDFLTGTGIFLGKLAALDWVLGQPMDEWYISEPTLIKRTERISVRTKEEVSDKSDLYMHALWLERHRNPMNQALLEEYERSGDKIKTDIAKKARYTAENLYRQYSGDPLFEIDFVKSDFGLINGIVLGKLSALRWVLGDDWDCWDT